MALLSMFINIFIRSAILGLVLMAGWNYGITKFFTLAPQVGLLEAFSVLFSFQTLSIFLMRPLRTEMVPIYLPADHFTNNDGE